MSIKIVMDKEQVKLVTDLAIELTPKQDNSIEYNKAVIDKCNGICAVLEGIYGANLVEDLKDVKEILERRR